MAQVYKFKVKLKGFENYIWRDIEITSVSSVAKLGYAVLVAFEAQASHLFCIEYQGINYEFIFDDFDNYKVTVNPSKTKLDALKLSIGDRLLMKYDYGAGWEFDIELISVTEMKRGSGTHYPYMTDGKGKGIIEDIFPGELQEYINQTDETGELPTYYDWLIDDERDWDYRDFDIENSNALYKYMINEIKDAYENAD